jgi:hypothetical protein
MKRIRSTRRPIAAKLGMGLVGAGAVAVAAIVPTLSLGAPAGPINPALVAKDLAGTVLPPGFSTTAVFTQGTPCVFDYDGDGLRDFLVSAHGDGWRLMKGKADGTFDEVERLPSTDRHGCAVGDFGGITAGGAYTGPDGRLDIFTTIGACQGTCSSPFPNELWLQRPDGTYVRPEQDARTTDDSRPNDGEDAAYHFGIADEHGRGREPLAFDANGDGKMDLFVGNDEGVLFDSRNRLYLNNGDGTFAEKPLPGGRALTEVGSLCSAAGDIDGDGDLDLLNCADTDYGKLQLYRNDGGGNFSDISSAAGVSGVFDGKDGELADIDGDGTLDLVLTRFNFVEVRLNRGGAFGEIDFQRKISGGSGLAVGDADGDGRKDLLGVTLDNELTRGADVLLRNMGRTDEAGDLVFEDIAFPQTTKGNGDVAGVLPSYDGTNRAAFIVTNGKWSNSGFWQFIYLTGPSTGPPEDPNPDPDPDPDPDPTTSTGTATTTGPQPPDKPGQDPGGGTTTPGGGGTSTGPDPSGPRGPQGPTGDSGKVTFTVAQLRETQRISQTALRRATALQAILDGRAVPERPAVGKSVRIKLSVNQLRINQRIAQAALRRVLALQARLDRKPIPKRTRERAAKITLSLKQMRINDTIARTALKRVDALAARMVREGYAAAAGSDITTMERQAGTAGRGTCTCPVCCGSAGGGTLELTDGAAEILAARAG